MNRTLIAVGISFVVGVGVGGLAFGQWRVVAPPSHPAATDNPEQSAAAKDASEAAAMPGDAPAPPAADADESSGVIEIELGPASEVERLSMIEARWTGLSTQIDRLSRRVVDLERQLAEQSGGPDEDDGESGPPALPIETPEDREAALIFAGVERRAAQDIVSRESELAMERLDLRDRAAREGWLGSERYFDELETIDVRAVDLRTEVGDDAFDRFLFETGQPNRVTVTSVFVGSQGELAGMLPGDIIEDYAGERVFDFNDLRSATTSGTRDETVPVTIRRGDQLIETWLARGPIGVSLETGSASPDG